MTDRYAKKTRKFPQLERCECSYRIKLLEKFKIHIFDGQERRIQSPENTLLQRCSKAELVERLLMQIDVATNANTGIKFHESEKTSPKQLGKAESGFARRRWLAEARKGLYLNLKEQMDGILPLVRDPWCPLLIQNCGRSSNRTRPGNQRCSWPRGDFEYARTCDVWPTEQGSNNIIPV